MKRNGFFPTLVVWTLSIINLSPAAAAEDEDRIRAAALDYIDSPHLAKRIVASELGVGDQWKIVNVLWEIKQKDTSTAGKTE